MTATPELVFIVGLPRTGSKLVQVVLKQSQQVCCQITHESWFFGDLFRSGIQKQIRRIGDMRDDANVGKLCDFLFSGEFDRSYWHLVRRPNAGFDRNLFARRLLETDRSERAMYLAIMEIYAERDAAWSTAARRITGDKTPGHLYYVPELLRWFPDAKIIHTFRDPRAIVASELKKIVDSGRDERSLLGNGLLTIAVVLYITITWLRARSLHYRYQRAYPANYLFSQYEQLVGDPEPNVRRICDFVGIDVHPDMLNPRHADSSFVAKKGPKGFHAGGLDRWRDYLKPWVQRWFRLWTGRHLAEFGYQR